MLEIDLKTQLQNSRLVRLIDHAERTRAERGRSIADRPIIVRPTWIEQIGMVEAVETLRARLKLRLFVQGNQLAECGIDVRVMWAVELVGTGISVGAGTIKRKRSGIQPSQAIGGVGIGIPNEVGTVVVHTG